MIIIYKKVYKKVYKKIYKIVYKKIYKIANLYYQDTNPSTNLATFEWGWGDVLCGERVKGADSSEFYVKITQ